MSTFIDEALACLAEAHGKPLSAQEREQLALRLAAAMLQEARLRESAEEKGRRAELARMMQDPKGKLFTVRMADQCFRSRDPARAADQIAFLLKRFGIPSFLSWDKQLRLKAFTYISKIAPAPAVALAKRMIRREAAPMIKLDQKEELRKHILLRRGEGAVINLNHVGEAILGEEEAKKRLETYLTDLADPEIHAISIKVSSIFSQINLLGWDETLSILEQRLKTVYRAAKKHLRLLPNGAKAHKLVTLDMEEYRDLHLTVELFKRTLDDAEFYDYIGGIVLQSYLPDAFLIQQHLTAWAMQRSAYGGAPIRIRLVKGANLAMEQVEAALHGWEQAPYLSKAETDANFIRMLNYGTAPKQIQAVHLGIGSHNLFDIAYALILKAEQRIAQALSFEMLEGMADSLRSVVQHLTGAMLLYCPAATAAHFQNAFAYLVRRLDENTAPDNFLHCLFNLTPGSEEWRKQSAFFSQSLQDAATVSSSPRRTQNRLLPPQPPHDAAQFQNEPDTDWTLTQNRRWAEGLIREHREQKTQLLPLFPTSRPEQLQDGIDPSCPGSPLYRYPAGAEAELEAALNQAVGGFEVWSKTGLEERLRLLHQVAHQLRQARGELIAAMMSDTGKPVPEGDAEISEAIDFITYYCQQAALFFSMPDLLFSPKGPIAVLTPWNFPCSIPTGGIAGALATGNSVIFKPAPEAVLVGWTLVNLFWKAGISRQVLQFFPCQDEPIGSALVSDPRIAGVVLTGGTQTAKQLLALRPGLDLMAETGGKNAIIVSNMADRDLAIRDIVHSAFSYAGQKCSACSLLVLLKEVYEDREFRKQLKDATASLAVGSAWNLATRINPLIRPPSPILLRGLTQLEKGEEWLLEPKQDPKNPHLWSPGIKLGVQRGSFCHQTELFGPMLSVMCADNLRAAIELANDTPYGLTAGLHSLDEREQQLWQAKILAGNCYINRTITGAIVRRQPFGGCKESCFGPGAKAGGPNYILQFLHAQDRGLPPQREPVALPTLEQPTWSPEEQELWRVSIESYQFYWNHHFSQRHDPSQIMGQDNQFFYAPHPHLVLRIQESDQPIDFLRAIAAALICQAHEEISLSQEQFALIHNQFGPHLHLLLESEQELLQRVDQDKVKRVRWLSTPSAPAQQQLAKSACISLIAPVLANGRLELLRHLREVSLSVDTHRYGFLGTLY